MKNIKLPKKRFALIGLLICSRIMCIGQPTDVLRAAAEEGSIDAMLYLSERYRLGDEVTRPNNDSANYFLNLAAKTDSKEAGYLLGISYLRGLGYKPSPKKAEGWLVKSAEQGHLLATNALIDLYSKPPNAPNIPVSEWVTPNPKLAFQYAEKSAKMRNEKGLIFIANAYSLGKGAKRNDSLAVALLDSAATITHSPAAQILLGDWYFNGTTIYGTLPEKAEKYYQMAINNPRTDIDQLVAAKIGAHYAPLLKRQVLNTIFLFPFPKPDHAIQILVQP